MRFLEPLRQVGVVLCCGSGGVGKTTISAALGMHGAMIGRKTLVLTIDPAKRLADSLGLGALSHEARQIPREKFQAVGLNPTADLYAMMLDTAQTFDRIIARYSISESMRQAILNNRYYQHISSTLAGSHEYMAIEKLYEIYQERQFDLIVLDTPPSRNALDFLDAPNRVANLLEDNLFRKILQPYIDAGKKGMRLFRFLASPFQKLIGKMLGGKVMDDLFDFFQLGNDVFLNGFRDRALAVKKILSGPDALFLAATSPMAAPMKEAVFLYQRLIQAGFPFGGFIVNRVHPALPNADNAAPLPEGLNNPGLRRRLAQNYQNFQALGYSDALSVRQLAHLTNPAAPIQVIPYLESDVYDFAGLVQVYEFLKQ